MAVCQLSQFHDNHAVVRTVRYSCSDFHKPTNQNYRTWFDGTLLASLVVDCTAIGAVNMELVVHLKNEIASDVNDCGGTHHTNEIIVDIYASLYCLD